ncbi:hypothetical protein BH20GEM1_BH20GEM1_07980 [soil metagenome]
MRLPLLLVFYGLGALSVSSPCAAQEPEDDRWLGPDKPKHAFAAGWVAGTGYAAGIELGWDPARRRWAAVGAALGVSLAKEAMDAGTEGGEVSFKDLAADALGIAAFVALSAAADR